MLAEHPEILAKLREEILSVVAPTQRRCTIILGI
jgi:septum formation topological specificity factor MinE